MKWTYVGGLLAVVIAVVVAAGEPSRSRADPSMDAEEQAFIALLNGYRADNGLVPLIIDPNIQAASEWMSEDMGVNAYFSHTDSLGRDPWQRMCDFGYCYNTWKGENIAAGFVTGASVFAGWQGSPGHNANMLGANYRVMGLTRVYTPGSPYGWYWTNDFGGYIANPTPSPPPGPTTTPSVAATPLPTQPQTPTAPPTPSSPATPWTTPSPTAMTQTPTMTATPTPTGQATPTPAPSVTASPAHTTSAPATTASNEPTAEPASTPGPEDIADMNCDSLVTGVDSLLLLEAAAELTDLPPCGAAPHAGAPEMRGDLDCSGSIGALDALVILLYLSGAATSPSDCAE